MQASVEDQSEIRRGTSAELLILLYVDCNHLNESHFFNVQFFVKDETTEFSAVPRSRFLFCYTGQVRSLNCRSRHTQG